MINVTKPFLPPKKEYDHYLQNIWHSNWVTNFGPLSLRLESELKNYLGVNELLFLSNGTIALQIAIKAIRLSGEIITTPFSYVATTSSIVWENCKPVFVDIDSSTLNIDPDLIESSINSRTIAILATHVFGNPCEIERIEIIAKKHGLFVIYDAAHCFGTKYKGKSVFNFGDISTASFHATKLFHTGEGGAVFTQSLELYEQMSYLRNFGHKSPTDFAMVGINGKNSELHAAMGLSVLPYMPKILEIRKALSEYYNKKFEGLPLHRQSINIHSEYNYSYYPVIFDSEDILIEVMEILVRNGVMPRRYFYPSLDTLNYVGQQFCPISRDISARILCLPLYHDLENTSIDNITCLISEALIKRNR